MVARQFIEGEKFQWQDQAYFVERRLQDGKVVIQEITTGVTQTHDLAQLEQALFDGLLAFQSRGRQARVAGDAIIATTHRFVALDDCPPHIAEEARLRYAFTKPLLDLEPKKRTNAYVKEYISKFWEKLSSDERRILKSPISLVTARRWIKMLGVGGGDIRALITYKQDRGAVGQPRLDERVEEIINQVIEELYLIPTHYPITPIHDEICRIVREENQGRLDKERLSFPSRATVARRIRKLERARVITNQKGVKEGKQVTQQYGRFEVPELPNQRWEIDGTPTDILIVDPVDNLPVGRMVLLACIDVCTKVIPGVSINYEEDYQSVAECLYNAILKGPSTREKYGTVNDVSLYGLPEQLVIDNGLALKNQHLKDACTLLGIHLDPTPVRKPESKPFIERFMGTVSSQVFHIAPGTTFSNVLERGSYNSAKQACLYLNDLERAIHIHIADVYSQDSHTGLKGRTPAQVLEGFYEDCFEVRLPPSAEELSILLGQVEHRTLDRNGFTFEHLRYNHPSLGMLRARLGGRGRIKIKYHADDLGQMHVFDPFENQYITVPALDQEYARGMSLWKHRILVKYSNRETGHVDRLALAEARRKVRDIFESSRNRKRASRFKQSRPAPWKGATESGGGNDDSGTATRDEETQAEIEAIFEQNMQKAKIWVDEEIYKDRGEP